MVRVQMACATVNHHFVVLTVIRHFLALTIATREEFVWMESVLASRDSKVKLAALVLTYVQTNVLVMDLVK
jgi:hypothetical protein